MARLTEADEPAAGPSGASRVSVGTVARPASAPVAALAGCTVDLAADDSGDVVQLRADTTCALSSSTRLFIFEPSANGPDRILATSPNSTSPVTATAVPRQTSGRYIAVVCNCINPTSDEWTATPATPWVAMSQERTTKAWTIDLTDSLTAETNYRWGDSTDVGKVLVQFYDLFSTSTTKTNIGTCGVPTGSSGTSCHVTGLSGQSYWCGRTMAMVTAAGPTDLPPTGTAKYKVSPPMPCPKPDPSSLSDCPACDGLDPVNTVTGALKESFLDVSIPGRGPGLVLARTYASDKVASDGWFGYGWTSTYETHLEFATHSATFVDSSGARETFTLQENGTYIAASNVYGSLVKQTDNNGVVTYKVSDWRARIAWTFDDTGRKLLKITDRNDQTTTLTWGTATVVVKDHAQRSMTLTFNGTPGAAHVHVTSVVDPMSRTTGYTYDASNNLATAESRGKLKSTFTYDTPATHLLNRITTPRGGYVNNAYDASNRVITQKILKAVSTTTDPNPKPTVSTIDYGTGGQATAAGGTTTITEKVPTTISANTNTQIAQTAYVYQNSQLTAFATDPGTAREAITTYTRDPASFLPVTVEDPMGNVTTYEHDSWGHAVKITDALNHVSQSRYDTAGWGQLTCTVDAERYAAGVRCPAPGQPVPLGASGWDYNAAGNLVSVTDPNGHTSTYAYGDPNHPQDMTTATDAEGRVFGFTYDAYGNTATSTQTPQAGVTLTSQTVYNLDSQPTCTVGPRQYAAGVRCPAPGGAIPAGASGVTYDSRGRVSATVGATGAGVTYGYDTDNNLTSMTKPVNGSVTTTVLTEYDLAGRVIKDTPASGSSSSMVKKVAYDQPAVTGSGCDPAAAGIQDATSCSTITDGAGKATVYYYTGRGELAGMKTPGNSTTKTHYRLDGLPDVVTLYGGRTLTNTYFADGTLDTQTSSVAGTTPVSYTYRPDGLRATMTDATGTTNYDYFHAGLLKSVTNTTGTVSYTWDDSNRLKTLTYPSGRVVTRGYDGAGRFVSVHDGARPHHHLHPRRRRPHQPDRLPQQHQRHHHPQRLRPHAHRILGHHLRHCAGRLHLDPNPHLHGQVRNRHRRRRRLLHLRLRPRLPLKTAGGATYTYDTGNHLTALGGPTLTYNTNGSGRLATRVSGGQTRTFTYTNANLTSNTVTSGTGTSYGYTFNGYNQIATATATTSAGVATTTNYTYDGDNLRQSKTSGTTTTRFAYDQSGPVPALIAEGTTEYIYGRDGQPIEHINTDNTGATYYLRDQHGDTRVLTDRPAAAPPAPSSRPTNTPPTASPRRTSGTAATTMLYGAGSYRPRNRACLPHQPLLRRHHRQLPQPRSPPGHHRHPLRIRRQQPAQHPRPLRTLLGTRLRLRRRLRGHPHPRDHLGQHHRPRRRLRRPRHLRMRRLLHRPRHPRRSRGLLGRRRRLRRPRRLRMRLALRRHRQPRTRRPQRRLPTQSRQQGDRRRARRDRRPQRSPRHQQRRRRSLQLFRRRHRGPNQPRTHTHRRHPNRRQGLGQRPHHRTKRTPHRHRPLQQTHRHPDDHHPHRPNPSTSHQPTPLLRARPRLDHVRRPARRRPHRHPQRRRRHHQNH